MFIKYKFHNCFFIYLCFIFPSFIYAQNSKLDSLKIVLKKSNSALEKARACVSIADELYINDLDTVLPLSEAALKLLEDIKISNEAQRQDVLTIKAWAINNIGYVYKNYGNQSKALFYFLQALKIREQINDEKGIIESYNNMASVYNAHGDSEGALKYYKNGLEMARKIKDIKGEANILNNMAIIYEGDSATYDLALNYFTKSLELETTLNNSTAIGKILHNIAVRYQNKDDYTKAKDFYNRSIVIKTQNEDTKGLMNTFNSLANLEFEKGNTAEAEKLAEKSLKFAEELELTYGIIQASQTLYQIYSIQNKWQKALQMHEIYSEYKDLQIEESNSDETTQMQMQFEFDKKMAADSLKVVEEQKLIAERFKSEKVQRYALYGGLFLVAIFAVFMFNRFKVTQRQKQIIEIKEKETYQQKVLVEEQKHLIEEKHKEITDSINYAERIQRSFLATNDLLKENLKDFFVFFRPKDVVSGDFYWATKLNDNRFALVTADSTGHGVPGAIMSILNISSIEKAIDKGNTETAEVLNHTRQTIIDRLKKDGSIDGGKDGMDCSLIFFDFQKNNIQYSAANNPIWIIRENELIELKPDKMPIGKHDKDNISFTQHDFGLNKGDLIYTLTDGLPDQFGGPVGKKFMYKKLKDVLISISNENMNNQQDIINKAFNDWKGSLEQVDDVTLIGIKIS